MIPKIKGIDVVLTGIDGVILIVPDVLVGEPTALDMTNASENNALVNYILAIPKGDENAWIDSKVTFYGRTFRTVGLPVQGMPDSMPLKWNKKVKVSLLETNATITLYEKDNFTRHVFADVHYSDERGDQYTKDGVRTDGCVSVHIYAVNFAGNTYVPKAGDIVVGYDCAFEFQSESQQAVSESMKTFRNENPDFSVIGEVRRELYGSAPDYLIKAK